MVHATHQATRDQLTANCAGLIGATAVLLGSFGVNLYSAYSWHAVRLCLARGAAHAGNSHGPCSSAALQQS